MALPDDPRHGLPFCKEAGCSAADWLFRNWQPSFRCEFPRRFGPLGLGGWWVCDPHRLGHLPSPTVLLSSAASSTDAAAVEKTTPGGSGGESSRSDDTEVEDGLPIAECRVYLLCAWWKICPALAVQKGLLKSCEIHVFIARERGTPQTSSSIKVHRVLDWNGWSVRSIARKLGHGHIELLLVALGESFPAKWVTMPDKTLLAKKEDREPFFVRQLVLQVGERGLGHQFFRRLAAWGYVIVTKEYNTQNCQTYIGGCCRFGFLRLHPSFTDV